MATAERARHVAVCGPGSSGARLVTELLEAGLRVVRIDVVKSNPARHLNRRNGAVVLLGDARRRATLEWVRLDRATYLRSTMGADDTNAEVVMSAKPHSGRVEFVAAGTQRRRRRLPRSAPVRCGKCHR